MGNRSGLLLADPVTELKVTAGMLAVTIAGIHLFHPQFGVFRLIEFVRIGTLFHPLPPVFTLASFLIVFGIVLAYQGFLVRAVYLAGTAMMIGFVVGYVAWHTLLDHGAFWPYIETHGHGDIGPVALLVEHARTDPLGITSKLLELLLAAVLLILYHVDSARHGQANPDA